MTTEESESISRALGRLEGTVQSLMMQWAQQEASAAAQRQKNNDKLEQLERTLDRLATDQQGMQQDVAELKNEAEPMIERFKAQENQKLGRQSVWVGLGVIISACGAIAYKAITDFLHHP